MAYRRNVGQGRKLQFTRTARKIKRININPKISTRGTCL